MPEASGSAQFPDADWLSLDVVQSGHSDGQHPHNPEWFVDMWHAKSSYEAIRKMYATLRPDGRPRPVMDLEAHYENTHYWFAVSLPFWPLQVSARLINVRPVSHTGLRPTFVEVDGRP